MKQLAVSDVYAAVRALGVACTVVASAATTIREEAATTTRILPA